MLEIVSQLIQSMNDAEIQYVHFKSNEHLYKSVDGKTDFDILIDRDSSNHYERILLKHNLKRFNSPERSRYPGVDDWIGFDYATGSLIHLHTHYQLVTGLAGYKNIVLPWTKLCLDTSIIDIETGMRIASPAFELIELYTRIVVKMDIHKRKVCQKRGLHLTGENQREASWLRERTDCDQVHDMLQLCYGENTMCNENCFFDDTITAKDFVLLNTLINDKLNIHKRECGWFISFKSFYYKKKTKIIRKLKKHIFLPALVQKKNSHTGGLLIAFLGVDGAGKTTVSSEITEWLSWKFETSHMGLGFGRYKNTAWHKIKMYVKKLISKEENNKPQKTFIFSETPIKRNKKNEKKQKKWVVFAKSINKDIRRIHSYCLSGGIMVVDRYPQLEFHGLADGPKVNIAYPDLQKREYDYLSIINDIQPDLVFKLFIPVELSKARRPEDSVEVLERKNEILHSINYEKSKIVDVDATQNLDDELLFIKREIWDML